MLDARHPLLVTLRARDGVTWLRTRSAFRALREALSLASRDGFRVVHFSVQADHLHLLVEANDAAALSRGMRGLAIRCALAVNRAVAHRGAIWAERYHARPLRTPREVRNALVYVLANVRKHVPAFAGVDPCSSASGFDGYREAAASRPDASFPSTARTWLLRVGWRRHGLLGSDERPAGAPAGCRRRSRTRHAQR